MGLEKRTLKIIFGVSVFFIIVGVSLGLLLGLLLNQSPYIELEAWPRPADGGRLVRFSSAEPASWHPWVRRINELLAAYETAEPEHPPRAPCSARPRYEEPQRAAACAHAMRYWAPCTVDTYYEYIKGTPCVFLRLAHIDRWSPQPYNTSVNLPIPSEMPEHLKKGLVSKNHPSAKLEDYIWVSCKGESPADEENVGGIQYIPENLPPGFPIRKLLTDNPEPGLTDDKAPLIAVLFQNITRGVIVNVECRIWTRDVVYDGDGSIGRTHFEILVD